MGTSFTLLAVLLAVCTSQATMSPCPPPESLLPCTCVQYSTWNMISCSNIRGRINFASIFSRVSSSTNSSSPLIFDTLRITGCSGLLDIPANSLADLSFYNIDISKNPNLDWISPKAFSETGFRLTKSLRLNENYLWNPAPYTNDIFKLVRNFEVLETVNLGMNRISSIPKRAFAGCSSLQRIDLDYNQIGSIEERAFSSTGNLTLVALTYNSITDDGIHPNAFANLGNSATILGLGRNNITQLREGTFKRVLNTVKEVIAGTGYCNPSACYYDYLSCDEGADWICKRREMYHEKLVGFRCTGDEFEDIWEYCESRQSIYF